MESYPVLEGKGSESGDKGVNGLGTVIHNDVVTVNNEMAVISITDGSVYCEEATVEEDNEFETMHLIVRSTDEIDTYGAVAVADGYRGITILQYDSQEATKEAYEKLKADDGVVYVQTDTMWNWMKRQKEKLQAKL